MNNPIKLSYSGARKYSDCGEAYRLHYIEKYRSNTQSAALFFGTAVGNASDALLLPMGQPEAIFLQFWSKQLLNDIEIDLKTSHQIVYSNSDFDEEIIALEDLEAANLPRFHDLKAKKDIVSWDGLEDSEKSQYNETVWYSLKAKGLLMIQALRDKVLPNIEHVYATQVPIKLENESGDEVPGFADWVVKWKDIPTPVVIDTKTSTRDYEEDAVLKSNQLATYLHYLSPQFEDTRYAGYVVLKKRVWKNKTKICSSCGHDGSGSRATTCDNEIQKKRCKGEWTVTIKPEIGIQILINKIPERLEEITLDNYQMITNAIKNNVFIRNFDACSKVYGKCNFYDLCHNKSEKGLIKMENKK